MITTRHLRHDHLGSGTALSDKRVVIVTDEGTGIGAATARLLRAAGHHVVISGRRPTR